MKSIDEMAGIVISHLEADVIEDIASMKKDDLIRLHHSLGQGIRNHFGLWKNSWKPVMVDGVDTSKDHPDEISFMVIEAIHEKLNKDS